MNIRKAHKSLLTSSIYMMKRHPFYSEVLLSCNFIEDKTIDSAGVNITYSGSNFYYNPEFLESLNEKQMNFLVIHELYHLLHNHVNRKDIQNYNHQLANIVQDMIINTSILQVYGDEFQVPTENLCLVPEEYDGEHIYEYLYDWMQQKKQEHDNKKSSSGNSNEQKIPERTGENDSLWGDGWEQIFDFSDESGFSGQFDEHLKDEVSEEIREAMIKDVINAARNRGIISSEIEKILEKIRKSRKNYLRLIKTELSGLMGTNKQKTWQRFSRRGSQSMSKGYKKYQKEINVILDTSGSMNSDFEKVLSYVFQHGITLNLIQCDTKVKKVSKINSPKELQKEKIVGLGGTTISPAIQHIVINNNLNRLSTLILTDGYTDELTVSLLRKKCLILSTERECPVDNISKVKQIVIDKRYS